MTLTRHSAAGSFTRAALHLARAQNAADAAFAAEQDRASNTTVNFLRTKAATVAGSLNASTWGSEIANTDGAAPGFIESLRSASLFYAMADQAEVWPMRTRVLATAALQVDTDTQEAGFLPVIQGSFEAKTLTPRMTGGIVVLSDELVKAGDPASFGVIQRELQKACIAAVDTAALTDVILDGVIPGALDLADPLAGIRAMLAVVSTTGTARLMWMAGATVANGLATAEGMGGRLFPEVTPNGGTLLGAPLMVSDRLDAGRLVLIDASAFAVNPGTVDVDRSNGAALSMKTDETGPAQLISMFQTNATALRIVAMFGIEKLRGNSVAIADLPGS